MQAGHFSHGQGDRPADQGADNVRDNHGRPGILDGGAGPQQEPRPNGAAHGHHGHLSGGELTIQAMFTVCKVLNFLLSHRQSYSSFMETKYDFPEMVWA